MAGGGTVHGQPAFAGLPPSDDEFVGQVVRGAEVHLVGRLAGERRMRDLRVVLLDEKGDQRLEMSHGVECVEVQPLMLEGAPPRLDDRVRVGDLDLREHAGELRGREGGLAGRRRRFRRLASAPRCRAAGYLGAPAGLSAQDGYVDTGDLVELQGGRYYFRGRKGGVINVGGLKVYPEEVESVLNADSRVRMSLVRARRNAIMGALVVADVVLNDPDAAEGSAEAIKSELLQACRQVLPAHKVPAMLRLVPTLELSAAGKLVRPDA